MGGLTFEHAKRAEDVRRNAAAEAQVPPSPGKTDVTSRVVKDLLDRSDVGLKKYGTRLKTHNGRKALLDAYQEALDLACYLKQALMEEEGE